MTAANFNIFYALPGYVTSNTWKDSLHVPELFQLILECVSQDLVVSPWEFCRPGLFMYPQQKKTKASDQMCKGARLLDLHIQTICCQRCLPLIAESTGCLSTGIPLQFWRS